MYIVASKCLSINVWQSTSVMLSVKVGHQLSFLGLLKSDSLETEVCFGWVQASDEVCRLFDFCRCYWTERMGRDMLDWCGHWGIRFLVCRHGGSALTVGIMAKIERLSNIDDNEYVYVDYCYILGRSRFAVRNGNVYIYSQSVVLGAGLGDIRVKREGVAKGSREKRREERIKGSGVDLIVHLQLAR